jgi:CRP-like cAMP-binding protein
MIETGKADVVGDGRLVTTLGPGDGFGEIALLRRVPRTAMVRAVSDLQLQALRCDRFLPVVMGFRRARGRRAPQSRRCATDSGRVDRLTTKRALMTSMQNPFSVDFVL